MQVRDDSRWDRSAWLGLAAIVILFCAPLFIGLDRWDQQSDEAIYSYSVERAIETGEWITPRAIYDDQPFYEKPPLKFWLVTSLIRLGVLPYDDRGLRALDVVLCGVAFVYVFLFARRIAGPLAGIAAVFLLFSFDPLILEHGVRGNNMDAMLVFAYCGGVWHFVRWVEQDTAAARRRHAYAWMLLFAAAFMTKFVAAVFLPIICAAALVLRPRPSPLTLAALEADWPLVRSRTRELLAPATLALLLILPWFLYETIRSPQRFWYEMVGVHVYLRFFDVLAPSHLRPWHHYFTQLWFELGIAGVRLPALLGVAALIWQGWGQRDWLARVAVIWWLLPLVLLSGGTSKLFYYSYPFLPPLGIGAGLVIALAFRVFRGPRVTAWLTDVRASLARRRLAVDSGRPRTALLVFGAVCFVLALATALHGPVTIEAGGVRLFRSSSVSRVLVLGALAWYLAGLVRTVPVMAGVIVAALLLPVEAYPQRVQRLSSDNHPLRATRDCALEVQRTNPSAARGVLAAGADLHHSYFFYLRHLGPYVDAPATALDEIERRLHDPERQTPLLIPMKTYVALGGSPPADTESAARAAPRTPAARGPLPPGYAIADVVMLLPGPYGRCVDAAHGVATALPPAQAELTSSSD